MSARVEAVAVAAVRPRAELLADGVRRRHGIALGRRQRADRVDDAAAGRERADQRREQLRLQLGQQPRRRRACGASAGRAARRCTPSPQHGASSRIASNGPQRGAGLRRVGAHHLGRLGARGDAARPAARRSASDPARRRPGPRRHRRAARRAGRSCRPARRTRRARASRPAGASSGAIRCDARLIGTASPARKAAVAATSSGAVEHDRRRHRRVVVQRPRRRRRSSAYDASAGTGADAQRHLRRLLPASIRARATSAP